MKKLSLTIAELLQLQAELVGNQNVKGLLALKLNMLSKYRLSLLYKVVSEELSVYQKINEELIKKYGEEKDGSFIIMNFVEDSKTGEKTLNPNIEKYAEEINPILQEERELETPEIKIGDFQDTKVEGYYPVFLLKSSSRIVL